MTLPNFNSILQYSAQLKTPELADNWIFELKKSFFVIIAFVLFLVFTFLIFPASYAAFLGNKIPIRNFNNLAFKLTNFYRENDINYGCGNTVYFGRASSFHVVVPSFNAEGEISNLLADIDKNSVIYFYQSDIRSEYDIGLNLELAEYNTSVFSECSLISSPTTEK